MKIKTGIFLSIILPLTIDLFSQSTVIDDYQKFFALGKSNNKEIAVIRKYKDTEKINYLGIGLNDLKTYILNEENAKITPTPWKTILEQYDSAPYIKAIKAAKQKSTSLQNAGIQHGDSKEKGISLTIDLCPSHKPLDRIIFSSIIEEFKKFKTPEPVALSITGKFLKTHPEDISWLKNETDSGALEIIWINHTYNHKYDPKLPLDKNFLLEAGTDLDEEILLLEKSLLETNLLPSAFIRFPGLVSDAKVFNEIIDYGLIPIGSDAWLAKGETAKNGDIVLIHGNGNEPLGVHDFINLLKKDKDAALKNEWHLYDLREAVKKEFEKNNQLN